MLSAWRRSLLTLVVFGSCMGLALILALLAGQFARPEPPCLLLICAVYSLLCVALFCLDFSFKLSFSEEGIIIKSLLGRRKINSKHSVFSWTGSVGIGIVVAVELEMDSLHVHPEICLPVFLALLWTSFILSIMKLLTYPNGPISVETWHRIGSTIWGGLSGFFFLRFMSFIADRVRARTESGCGLEHAP